jgi:hypothetical protein
MMVVVVYHIGAVGYRLFVRRIRPTILPSLSDVVIAVQSLLFNLGIRKEKPQQGRYTFEEKFEYWAVVWGTIIMGITGFAMWNPIATTRFLPGEIVPAAKAAHGGEALLAVISIAIWHLYHVLVRHFNKSMFTGYLSEKEMLEDHPLELADIKAGTATLPVTPEQLKVRRRVFWPAYGVLAVGMLFGIVAFVRFEQTAITTLPPRDQVEVFDPLPPTPFPTPIPTQPTGEEDMVSWDQGFGKLFQEACGTCHGAEVQLGGLDLSTYETALEGGTSGLAIVAGDPESSLIITVQSAVHPGQLNSSQLERLTEWIASGAPER